MNSSDKQIIKIHRKRLSCADNDSNFGNYKNIEEDWENLQNNSTNKNNKLLTLNKNIKMICDQLYNTNISKNLNNSILHNQSNHYNHISLTEGK